MRKSKENETLKNDKNLDSNELARENVIKTSLAEIHRL